MFSPSFVPAQKCRLTWCSVALLPFILTACDQAKDLVEQGKKQAAELQDKMSSETTTDGGSTTIADSATTPAEATGSDSTANSVTPAPQLPVNAEQVLANFEANAPAEKTDQDLQAIGGLPENIRARLTVCNLTGSRISAVGMQELSKFPNLIELNLANCQGITDQSLAAIKDLHYLEILNLNLTPLSSDCLRHLADLTSLKHLEMNLTKITDQGFEHLKGLNRLEHLSLMSVAIDGTGFSKMTTSSTLKVLHVNNTQFGKFGFKSLRSHSKLEELNARNAGVHDDVVGAIKGHSQIVLLDLGENPLTDVGGKQLGGLVNLDRIHLDKTQVSNLTVPAFRLSKNMTQFDAYQTGISTVGAEQLKKYAPNVKVRLN